MVLLWQPQWTVLLRTERWKKPLIFIQRWLGMERERDGDCAGWGCSGHIPGYLCSACLCAGTREDPDGGKGGLGWWHYPTNPPAFQKASRALCGQQDADKSRPLGGLKSGQTLGKYSVIAKNTVLLSSIRASRLITGLEKSSDHVSNIINGDKIIVVMA